MPNNTDVSKDTSLTETATKIGDTLFGARDDKSGLSSAVLSYMGAEESAGRQQVRERARHAGLADKLHRWEHETMPAHATEDEVTSLLTPEEIDRFSAQTGLSRPATLAALTEILPNACRLDHIKDRQDAEETGKGFT